MTGIVVVVAPVVPTTALPLICKSVAGISPAPLPESAPTGPPAA